MPSHSVIPVDQDSPLVAISKSIKRFAARIRLDMRDLVEQKRKVELFGEQAHLVPPLRLMNDGPISYESFKENGAEYFEIFVRLCGLRRTDQILDIGCGIGRKTLPLLDYLDPIAGRYFGIDAHRPHVEWCEQRIESDHPNFHFQYVDIWSKRYNPTGKIRASEFEFPFDDNEFDFVILGSVFTHMFMMDLRHYVSEIQRVLKPGGRGMISFFLLNPESEKLITEGRSTVQLVYPVEPGCKAEKPDRQESAVGHAEDEIIKLFNSHGIIPEIHYGSWCGRKEFLTYQDIVHIEKR